MKTLAYLDAGSGSVMLQALLGGLAGLAVVGKLVLGKFLFFRRKDKAPSDLTDVPDDAATPTSSKSNV